MKFPSVFDRKADYKLATVFIAAFLVLFVLFNVLAWACGWEQVSVFAANEVMDKYQVRSQLLMQATDAVGSCDPESAALTWARGLKERNAALQYAVMTRDLKTKYAADLEKTFPNWVTGMSSPWVDSFKVLSIRETGDDVFQAKLQFVTATSTGPFQSYNATLTIAFEEGFWRVGKVVTDAGLLPYTGFAK